MPDFKNKSNKCSAQAGKQTDGQTGRQMEGILNWLTDQPADRQRLTDLLIDRKTGRPTSRPTDSQTNSGKDRPTDKQRRTSRPIAISLKKLKIYFNVKICFDV